MIFITLLISFVAVLPLLAPGYFPMHDDLQVMRLFELEKCFADGQVPCRWSPDMSYGYGQAMFNFYSAFPYYLGQLIRLIAPFSIVDTVKILFAISLIASGVGMYHLAREFFSKYGALLSSALYLLAPYRAVNVYVRGAMAEAFSLSILPFLWLAVYRIIKSPSYKNVLFLAIVTAAQLSTHNISTMIYAPFTIMWALFWLVKNKNIRNLCGLILGGGLGVGLSAFFIVPVFLEKSLIKEEIFTSDYSYYAAHFVSLFQLFISRFWGFGGSIFGDGDGMSFQVGIVHWVVAAVTFFVSSYRLIKTKKDEWLIAISLVVMGFFSLLLTHQKSYLIWEGVPLLSFVQFPWRFLGLAIFFFSFAIGSLSLIKHKATVPTVFAIVIVAFLFNISYFKPEIHFYEETDKTKLSGELFVIQQKAAYLDYLPKTVPEAPISLAPQRPQVVSGVAEIPNFTKTSSTFFFDANVAEDSEIDIPIIYFPDWEVYILEGQGEKLEVKSSGKHGTIHISLPPGKHMVYGRFVNTPIRTVANFITLGSILVLISGAVITNNKKNFFGISK